jgi:hypothetical protein
MEATIDGVYLSEKWIYNGRGKSWDSIRDLKESEPHIPLWTLRWDPDVYNDGKPHKLMVKASDSMGLSSNHTLIFRIDGKPEKMSAGIGLVTNFRRLYNIRQHWIHGI